MKNKLNLFLGLILLLSLALGCNLSESKTENPKSTSESKSTTQRIDGYNVRGFEFAYYKIPAGLSRQELIATAQKLHQAEPKAQLILVDDASQVQDYINYAKSISAGNEAGKLPKEWADKHIVANVQKYTSGKFMLCEGYGYKEIAELK